MGVLFVNTITVESNHLRYCEIVVGARYGQKLREFENGCIPMHCNVQVMNDLMTVVLVTCLHSFTWSTVS